jgi:hypothetical protein
MTVRPDRVLAGRRPGVVEEALLCEQHERPLAMAPCPRASLRLGDLGERAAEVYRRRLGGLGSSPRDRAVERVVDLEHARAVAEAAEPAAVAHRQPVTGNRQQLARRDVAEDEVGAR